MASEIKVDTISEKTAANGVTIDGVLIKDGSINGLITGADSYRMTSDLSTTTTPITAWERPDGTLQSTAYIGSGMSVSSGIFTFLLQVYGELMQQLTQK